MNLNPKLPQSKGSNSEILRVNFKLNSFFFHLEIKIDIIERNRDHIPL